MPTSQRATSEIPIRVIIGDTVLTGRLWDNATARDLIAQLPLTLTFRDFNGVEKIAQLPRSNRSAIQPNRQLSRNIANRQISPGQAYYGA